MVAQSHNIPILSCNIRIILFVCRAKSQHICLGSRKVASYLFWFVQSRANFSVAQSHNIPILSRLGRNIPFLVRAKSHRICFGSRKVAQNFGRAKSQHTHSESQWPQHTFFGSRKIASYLIWFAQSRANFLVAQSHNIPILSPNGRNIPFLVRAKSHHIYFGSRKVAQNFGRAKLQHCILSRNAHIITLLGHVKAHHICFGSRKTHHICFGSRKVAQCFRSHKVATYPL